jgi:pimeloyl-ACP methyl ester carboxylesterase
MIGRGEVSVDGRPTVVWTGGVGDALLLLHGAWAGAEVHWAGVWDRLAADHRVVAPDVLASRTRRRGTRAA